MAPVPCGICLAMVMAHAGRLESALHRHLNRPVDRIREVLVHGPSGHDDGRPLAHGAPRDPRPQRRGLDVVDDPRDPCRHGVAADDRLQASRPLRRELELVRLEPAVGLTHREVGPALLPAPAREERARARRRRRWCACAAGRVRSGLRRRRAVRARRGAPRPRLCARDRRPTSAAPSDVAAQAVVALAQSDRRPSPRRRSLVSRDLPPPAVSAAASRLAR
ncbi:MAG: hypothetical protein JWQ48_34 [Conexibacter sp.]|nr:hypothetical protein [Conexibacter sp.]